MGSGGMREDDANSTVVDPPINELPTAIDRPQPRAGDSIARSRRSVAPTPTPTSLITTAADAMRDEEVHRTRVFIRLGWVASLGGLATIPIIHAERHVTI